MSAESSDPVRGQLVRDLLRRDPRLPFRLRAAYFLCTLALAELLLGFINFETFLHILHIALKDRFPYVNEFSEN